MVALNNAIANDDYILQQAENRLHAARAEYLAYCDALSLARYTLPYTGVEKTLLAALQSKIDGATMALRYATDNFNSLTLLRNK